MKCVVKVSVLRKNLGAYPKPVAFMVKANAYGCGVSLVREVDDLVCAYGVATEAEGVQLRKLTAKPILITAPNVGAVQDICTYGLTPLVSTARELYALSACRSNVVAHLKVDSGMHRFGTQTVAETVALCRYANTLSGVQIKGIATHFSSPNAYLREAQRFDKHVRAAESILGRLLRHASASSTALFTDYDMLRIGYGVYRNALRVISEVACVKKVKKGECVGYGEKYVAPKEESIAVVYGGYADGIRRSTVGYKVRIGGKRHPIVAVCMDVFIVSLTGECKEGDEVVVVGSAQDLQKMAEIAQTIDYELMVGFAGRNTLEYEKRTKRTSEE